MSGLPVARTWCRFTPGTVAGIYTAIGSYHLPPGYNYAQEKFATLARVRFLGLQRPVLPIIRRFSNMYDLQVAQRDSTAGLQRELVFEELGDTLWLPVHETIIGYFAREVRSGDSLTIFVQYVGTFVPPDSQQIRVLEVTEFEAVGSASGWLAAFCADNRRA